jgi:hypothetical protein
MFFMGEAPHLGLGQNAQNRNNPNRQMEESASPPHGCGRHSERAGKDLRIKGFGQRSNARRTPVTIPAGVTMIHAVEPSAHDRRHDCDRHAAFRFSMFFRASPASSPWSCAKTRTRSIERFQPPIG